MLSLPKTQAAVWLAVISLLGGVARAEVWRIAIGTDTHPMSFLDAQGRPAGFAVDLIDAISREMHQPVVYVAKPWNEVFADFNAGESDVIASISDIRQQGQPIDVAVPHLILLGGVFVRAGDKTLRQPSDLGRHRVHVERDGYSHQYLRSHGWDQHAVFAPHLRDALHALSVGQGEAVLAPRIVAKQIIHNDRLTNLSENHQLELPDFAFRLRMGVHAGDARRLAILNEGLARLRANGRYDEIYERWIGPLEPRHLGIKDLQAYLLPVALVLFASLAALVWQRRMIRRVAAQAEALRRSEERLTLVLEGSDDGFWDWDLRTDHLEYSERWAAMLGYGRGEIESAIDGWKKLVHPDDLPQFSLEDIRTRLDDGSTNRFDNEYRMITRSGQWCWIHCRGKVVARDEHGAPVRMAGTCTDITQRKCTEAALRESERLLKRSAQLLEQTQSAAHIGGWEVDLRTDRLFWTDETYRLHDTSPEEFQPTFEKAALFYTDDSRRSVFSAFEIAFKSGTPFDLELDLNTARQRSIRVHLRGRAELENGRVVKIYGSLQDITDAKVAAEEREKLQLKMLDAQKLESLGVLAGGIAHDFNNLLTVILANASFARLAPSAAGSIEDRLTHIENAAQRAADLCRQMLAYAGQGNFMIERVDLSTLVQDTARLLLVSIGKKARLELALTPMLPPVNADPSQLRQVVMNLVINASEALGDAAGEIRLTSFCGRPEDHPGGVIHSFDLLASECICLEVSDTGSGMSSTTLARIFDPFFTTKFAGRGLGLASVLGIVRAHRGALTVHSTPGRGSAFRLYLPVMNDPVLVTVPPPPASGTEAGPPASGMILVADDEPIILATTDAVLRHHGYTTALAADGAEALQLFRAQPDGFTAVLLDLTMPGLDGAEVLREIRLINPRARVLLMSGYSEQDVIERLRGQDRVAILRKPFTQAALISRIAETAHPV